MRSLTKRVSNTETRFRRAHELYSREEIDAIGRDMFNALLRAIARLPLTEDQNLSLRARLHSLFVEEMRQAPSPLWRVR